MSNSSSFVTNNYWPNPGTEVVLYEMGGKKYVSVSNLQRALGKTSLPNQYKDNAPEGMSDKNITRVIEAQYVVLCIMDVLHNNRNIEKIIAQFEENAIRFKLPIRKRSSSDEEEEAQGQNSSNFTNIRLKRSNTSGVTEDLLRTLFAEQREFMKELILRTIASKEVLQDPRFDDLKRQKVQEVLEQIKADVMKQEPEIRKLIVEKLQNKITEEEQLKMK